MTCHFIVDIFPECKKTLFNFLTFLGRHAAIKTPVIGKFADPRVVFSLLFLKETGA